MPLFEQRCLNHSSREAVGRCPSCKHFYCRECVVEHDGRLTCTRCLAAAQIERKPEGARWGLWPTMAAAGFLLAWMVHYYLGWALSQIPASFHKGTS